MPPAKLTDAPWLGYWYGTSLIWTQPSQAQTWLAPAHERFTAQYDVLGQILSVAGLLESFYIEFSDDSRMDHWLAVMEALVARDPQFPTREQAVRPYATLVTGLVRRNPAHPLLRYAVERIVALVAEPMESNDKINAAGHVLQYLHFLPHFETLESVVALVEPVIDRPGVMPFTRMVWFCHLG